MGKVERSMEKAAENVRQQATEFFNTLSAGEIESITIEHRPTFWTPPWDDKKILLTEEEIKITVVYAYPGIKL